MNNVCDDCIYSDNTGPTNQMTCRRFPPTVKIITAQGMGGAEVKVVSVRPVMSSGFMACGEYIKNNPPFSNSTIQ